MFKKEEKKGNLKNTVMGRGNTVISKLVEIILSAIIRKYMCFYVSRMKLFFKK